MFLITETDSFKDIELLNFFLSLLKLERRLLLSYRDVRPWLDDSISYPVDIIAQQLF